ncbi:hypothetical protein ES319_D02G105200v1 [Gossypium barbadense]|uniref:Alpha/beta hydrolase fold-3 domain-containing protein n=2 Tax=Gossypium TaxID=3633 RepID=A0A5J5SAZ9_GOSBA|nr:hypothetical protein ES319_D02G105200v1 [Gossypium barbadense]PPE01795.1 hypothetical protein GOBAR_DD01175 [Gossypium barbadense]TYG79075.1 hypothetical protein ES288_D02G112700v1 [Gossypium darwinii]
MGSDTSEVALDLFPYLKVYKDGTLERIAGVEVVPPGLDPQTNVLSKDILVVPQTGVSARIYRPNFVIKDQKLPFVVYFHGGAFCVASPAFPNYHNSLNKLVAEANIVALSVDYRLVPEHPLPTAYQDSWAALQWVASHKEEDGHHHEGWIKDYVDLDQVFLVGDSAGANIAHHLAFRIKESDLGQSFKILGIGMIHPYFWGTNPIGSETADGLRKELVDKWWLYVCPSDKGCDDPFINPFVDGSPDLAGLACHGILVIVAEKDILRDRGRFYYDKLVKSGRRGKAEIMENEGEDHVFHIFNPDCDKAKSLMKRLAAFLNQGSGKGIVE